MLKRDVRIKGVGFMVGGDRQRTHPAAWCCGGCRMRPYFGDGDVPSAVTGMGKVAQ